MKRALGRDLCKLLCVCGVEDLGNGMVLDSRLYLVCVGCWYPGMWSGVKDMDLLDTLVHGELPKALVFVGEPEMRMSVNLSGLEAGEEHAREELVVAP